MATLPLNGHRRLATKVFDAVRADILSGALAPDAQLSEADLSERLGVSRTPVREALIKLSEDGLVRIVPQVGTFVAPISFEAVREAQFIRESLECSLIIDTARLAGEAAIRRMRANLVEQDGAVADNDWERFFLLDEALHADFADASGHTMAWRMVQQCKTHMDRIRKVSFRMPHHMGQLARQHADIVDAVARGDAAAAQMALRGHLREIFATLDKLGLARLQPQYPGDRS